MDSRLTNTAYLAIDSDCGIFKLWDLFDKNGNRCNTPVMEVVFKDDYEIWDNSDYVVSLLQSLKEDTWTNDIKEFIEFCENRGLKFTEVKKSLISVFDDAIKIKLL